LKFPAEKICYTRYIKNGGRDMSKKSAGFAELAIVSRETARVLGADADYFQEWEKGWQSGKKFAQTFVRQILEAVQKHHTERRWDSEDKIEREVADRELIREVRQIARSGGVGDGS
jgi:hypothetical protein